MPPMVIPSALKAMASKAMAALAAMTAHGEEAAHRDHQAGEDFLDGCGMA